MTKINRCEDLEKLVAKMGFLPFFANGIEDFSIEEFTPQELWFSDEEEGPWEWKGPVIRNFNCAYGKLFQKKAGFVSMEWFPELVNYRRAMYNLKAEPLQSMGNVIYKTVTEHESLLSKEIKALCGYKKQPVKRSVNPFDSWETSETQALLKKTKPKGDGFETVITRLQMWLISNTDMTRRESLTDGVSPDIQHRKYCSAKKKYRLPATGHRKSQNNA